MTLDEELKAIEGRANAATPGPWRITESAKEFYGVASDVLTVFAPSLDGADIDDALFISAARTDVPRLVAALRLAIEQRDHWIGRYLGSGVTVPMEATWPERELDNAILRALRGEI